MQPTPATSPRAPLFSRLFCRPLALGAFAAASLCSTGAMAQFSSLYVFGDSLSDSGNNALSFGGATGPNPTSGTFIPTLPYSPSRTYSNGPTWVTGFASGLGLSAFAAPSLGGGGNYAYGGAVTTGAAAFPPSLQSQVGTYLSGHAVAAPGAVFVVAGGGNDARAVATDVQNGANLVQATAAGAATYANTTLSLVNSLKASGATKIIVWNVPDLGKTPAAGSGVGQSAAAGSFIAAGFNSALTTALASSGVTLFDAYGLIDQAVATPALYGFGNVTQACGFAGNNCNASNALFWDGIHPTAFAQNFIASRMLAAVPEPGTVWMFAAGLAGFALAVKRRG